MFKSQRGKQLFLRSLHHKEHYEHGAYYQLTKWKVYKVELPTLEYQSYRHIAPEYYYLFDIS